MKKIISVLFTTALLAGSVFAQEWGGIVTNQTKATTSNFKNASIEQSNAAYAWYNTAITSDSKWNLSSEVMYKYNFGYYGEEIGTVFTNVIDFDLLKVNGTANIGSGTATMAFGRYFVSDNSSIIFSQNCDGAMIKYGLPTMTLSGYLGFTGLLNGLNVSMLNPVRNEEGTAVVYAKKENANFYSLAHPIIPVILSMDFNSLFGNQTLNLQGMYFADLGKDEEGSKLGDRFYFGVTGKGPISGAIYYEASTVLGAVNFKKMSNYTRAQVLCYPIDVLSFKGGLEYISGNQGIFKTFTGVTSGAAYNSLLSPEYGGQLIPQLSIVYSTDTLYTEIGSKVIFKMPEDSCSIGGLEEKVSFVMNIFSDLQAGLELLMYYDLSGAGETNYYGIFNMRVTF